MAITVTATGGGTAANGITLAIEVLTNAVYVPFNGPTGVDYSAVPIGGTYWEQITSQVDGTVCYTAVIDNARGSADTAQPLNNTITAVYDSAHSQARSVFATSTRLQAGTTQNVGAASGTTGQSCLTEFFVQPSGGIVTRDGSTPAAVNSNTATTITTASFSPPPGSLIVAAVVCNGGAGITTMTVTDTGGLHWISAGPNGNNGGNTPHGLYTGFFYAYVPAAPRITTVSIPGAAVGGAYSFGFTGIAGTATSTWSVTSGSLPAGLSLSSAGVVSGTPTTAGFSAFTVQLQDSFGHTAAASYSLVVNAGSTPGGVVRATWALAAGQYSYGTLEIPVSTQDHDWLIVSASWIAGQDTAIAYCADSAHNFYQAVPAASGGQVNTQVFAVPNARAASAVYVSTSAYVRWLTVQVTEVTGLEPGYVVDASSPYTGGPATTFTESLSTASADFILAVGALEGAPQTVTQSGTGATWTALTGSINGNASGGVTQSLAWAETSGAASPSMQFSGTSGFYGGVMVAFKRAGGLPVNANPGWPVIACQAAFGYVPQAPTAQPVWTDITGRFRGLNGQRGRSFELDEITAADMTVILDNFDGALSPQNTASPYYPNVTLITPVRVTATWQGRTYDLFRGIIMAIPQTYDYQRGLVKVACSDDWSKLPATLLGSCMIQEMLYDNPLNLWPLNDPQGAPYASNWSGRSGVNLTPASGTQGSQGGGGLPADQLNALAFGKSFPVASSSLAQTASGASAMTGATSPSTAAAPATGFGNANSGIWPGGLAGTTDTVWGNATVSWGWNAPAATIGQGTFQGTVLMDASDSSLPLTTTGATYSAWVQMSSFAGSLNYVTGFMIFALTDSAGTAGSHNYLSLWYDFEAHLQVEQTAGNHQYIPSVSLFDGKWHLWTVTVTQAGVVTVYVDGALLGSFTGSFPAGSPTYLQWGGDVLRYPDLYAGLGTGCIALAGVYDRAVDAERIQQWYLSGTSGFLDELAGTRIQRILAWVRWSGPQAVDAGLTMQQAFNYLGGGYASNGLTGAIGNYHTAGGATAVDTGAQADMTVQDIANTENGLLAVTAGGCAVFRNRDNLSSFPVGLAVGDMDYALNQTVLFNWGLGEWVNTTSCTAVTSSGWSYDGGSSGLLTVTGTPTSASVAGGQFPVPADGTAGFSAWVMSPQGCYVQLGINWYGYSFADVYQDPYTDYYGLSSLGIISATSGTVTYCPPMTPVQVFVPQAVPPLLTLTAQGVISVVSSPATGTQLYFDHTRLSPAGFQVAYKNDNPGDVEVTEDIQYLFNDIAVTRNADQASVRARNTASRNQYYPRPYTRTVFSSPDDPNALTDCANTLLTAFGTPRLRVQKVTIDAASNPEYWPFVLSADIGDLVSFARTPVGGAMVTGSFLVLNVQVEYAPDKAQFTYALVPAGVF